jgi:hypothetical protein
MRYIIAVLAVAGIVVSCLSLAQYYGAPAQPIDLTHSAWNSAYVNQSSFATVYGMPVALVHSVHPSRLRLSSAPDKILVATDLTDLDYLDSRE